MQHPQPGVRAGYTTARPYVLSVAKILFLGIGQLPSTYAAPMLSLLPFTTFAEDAEPPMSPAKPTLWIYLAVAIALVLLGGAFAGLTIALMGQVRVPVNYFSCERQTLSTHCVQILGRNISTSDREIRGGERENACRKSIEIAE